MVSTYIPVCDIHTKQLSHEAYYELIFCKETKENLQLWQQKLVEKCGRKHVEFKFEVLVHGDLGGTNMFFGDRYVENYQHTVKGSCKKLGFTVPNQHKDASVTGTG